MVGIVVSCIGDETMNFTKIFERIHDKPFLDLSEIEVAGACLSFFFESHDTFPNILVMALYQLAKNPHIQSKLAQSIDESIAANNDDVTYDLIHKHEYLEKVLYGKMSRR